MCLHSTDAVSVSRLTASLRAGRTRGGGGQATFVLRSRALYTTKQSHTVRSVHNKKTEHNLKASTGAQHPSWFRILSTGQKSYRTKAEGSRRRCLAEAPHLHGGSVEVSICLRPWPPHGGTLAAIEHPEVDSRAVDHPPHHAVQGVDLPHDVPLADAPNGWVARKFTCAAPSPRERAPSSTSRLNVELQQ